MNFKDLYKVIALTYCARVQSWWFHNMGRLGKQINNYPNSGNVTICLADDLYKASLENDDEVFTYLRDLRNKYKIVLYDDGFMSKLPKIVWA